MATANTETIPTSHTNGVIEDGYDDEDKTKMRPADIDADMREMERRKRVELIMNSRLFREELERIIESQMRDGNNSAGLLQQISDMVGAKYNNHFFRNASCVVPINDIRGIEAMGFVKGEKILRCKLAALFRIIDLYGWSQNIYNHVTARLSHQEEHFLVNPYGLLYSEVTASSLAKVDMQGGVIESGTTNFNVSVAGFKLHAAIYSFRPDLKCIIHLHTPSVLAISSLKDGLLPLCQEAAVIGEVSSHTYTGTPTDSDERDKIARSLGPNNKVIFLTNHGALCCGETIEETFFNAYNTVSACETQLKIMPLGKDNLLLLSDETRKTMYDSARKMPENVGPANSNAPPTTTISEKRWRVGGLEFEALMRMLDNAGFRTGYIYRTPLIKGELPRPRNDVEVPPAVSSLGYLLEEEELYKQGAWRKYAGSKGSDRIRWLNSPNVYQKVEILETGTTDPRKITKWVGPNNEEWVAEGSPSHTSTPVKIENALQFVPKNTNPKEFKKLQQQIKDNRRADKITSGPQSHILEGVSWEEAKKLQDANMSGTSDQVILVGAASKGIIQREFQHNATVYKTPYAKNPFDAVTDEELENYKKDVNRKQRGSSYYDEDESDSLPVKGVTSETEDDSLARDTRVIRIQTSTAPKESRAEVVLSDDHKKSKNKFMQSLGSMLSLRRELASFFDRTDMLSTSMWEMRKFFPTKRFVTKVRIVSYPTENEEPPMVIYLSTDADDGTQLFESNPMISVYPNEELKTMTWKRVFKHVFQELAYKLKTGDIFRRTIQSSSTCAEESDPLVLQSFDSSEVEYTTWTEIPNYGHRRRLESPHDFSSNNTTEDEDDALSSPGSGGELRESASWPSMISCIGMDYEEVKAPHLELTLAEAQELTTSFKSTSDDTSVEDMTVIYCPSANAGEERDDSSSSNDGQSITDDVSINSISDDEATYSRYNNVDYDDQISGGEIATTSSKCRDSKFYTDLSVIYEEERIKSEETANINADEELEEVRQTDRVTKISESDEVTEEVQQSFPLSGYESASTFEADSSELEDSIANVKHSPGKSEMTWTVDDLSSIEEADEIVQQVWNQESNEDLLSVATCDSNQFVDETEKLIQTKEEEFLSTADDCSKIHDITEVQLQDSRSLDDSTNVVKNNDDEFDGANGKSIDDSSSGIQSFSAEENILSVNENNDDQLNFINNIGQIVTAHQTIVKDDDISVENRFVLDPTNEKHESIERDDNIENNHTIEVNLEIFDTPNELNSRNGEVLESEIPAIVSEESSAELERDSSTGNESVFKVVERNELPKFTSECQDIENPLPESVVKDDGVSKTFSRESCDMDEGCSSLTRSTEEQIDCLQADDDNTLKDFLMDLVVQDNTNIAHQSTCVTDGNDSNLVTQDKDNSYSIKKCSVDDQVAHTDVHYDDQESSYADSIGTPLVVYNGFDYEEDNILTSLFDDQVVHTETDCGDVQNLNEGNSSVMPVIVHQTCLSDDQVVCTDKNSEDAENSNASESTVMRSVVHSSSDHKEDSIVTSLLDNQVIHADTACENAENSNGSDSVTMPPIVQSCADYEVDDIPTSSFDDQVVHTDKYEGDTENLNVGESIVIPADIYSHSDYKEDGISNSSVVHQVIFADINSDENQNNVNQNDCNLDRNNVDCHLHYVDNDISNYYENNEYNTLRSSAMIHITNVDSDLVEQDDSKPDTQLDNLIVENTDENTSFILNDPNLQEKSDSENTECDDLDIGSKDNNCIPEYNCPENNTPEKEVSVDCATYYEPVNENAGYFSNNNITSQSDNLTSHSENYEGGSIPFETVVDTSENESCKYSSFDVCSMQLVKNIKLPYIYHIDGNEHAEIQFIAVVDQISNDDSKMDEFETELPGLTESEKNRLEPVVLEASESSNFDIGLNKDSINQNQENDLKEIVDRIPEDEEKDICQTKDEISNFDVASNKDHLEQNHENNVKEIADILPENKETDICETEDEIPNTSEIEEMEAKLHEFTESETDKLESITFEANDNSNSEIVSNEDNLDQNEETDVREIENIMSENEDTDVSEIKDEKIANGNLVIEENERRLPGFTESKTEELEPMLCEANDCSNCDLGSSKDHLDLNEDTNVSEFESIISEDEYTDVCKTEDDEMANNNHKFEENETHPCRFTESEMDELESIAFGANDNSNSDVVSYEGDLDKNEETDMREIENIISENKDADVSKTEDEEVANGNFEKERQLHGFTECKTDGLEPIVLEANDCSNSDLVSSEDHCDQNEDIYVSEFKSIVSEDEYTDVCNTEYEEIADDNHKFEENTTQPCGITESETAELEPNVLETDENSNSSFVLSEGNNDQNNEYDVNKMSSIVSENKNTPNIPMENEEISNCDFEVEKNESQLPEFTNYKTDESPPVILETNENLNSDFVPNNRDQSEETNVNEKEYFILEDEDPNVHKIEDESRPLIVEHENCTINMRQSCINECGVTRNDFRNDEVISEASRAETSVYSSIEKTVLLCREILDHVASYRNSIIDTADDDSRTPSMETVAVRSQLLVSENRSSNDNTVSDSSLHSDIADVDASENLEKDSHMTEETSEKELFDKDVISEISTQTSPAALSEKNLFDSLADGPQCPSVFQVQNDSFDELENSESFSNVEQGSLNSDVVYESCLSNEAMSNHSAFQKDVEFEEKGVNTSVPLNPSVSCQYDYNQNEIPADKSANANNTQEYDSSDCGDIKFTLSLHIEWNDDSTSHGSSSAEPNFRYSDRNRNTDQSSTVDESFEDSDAGSPSATPRRYSKSLFILKDFKQNYPKFIQYSDFSPKIKSKHTPRKCTITPKRCKRGSVYPGKNYRPRRSRECSAEDEGYHQYSRLSADMPSFAHQSSSKLTPLRLSASSPQGQKSTNSMFNCDFKSTMTPLKSSTPTEAKEKAMSTTHPLLPTNSTSLEEFELLESLLETD